jgi:surface antigen
MKRIVVAMLTALILIAVTGCETREKTGALVGGTTGAVLGREIGDGTAATLLGAVGGALLGREVGKRLDERDRKEIAETLETRETGEAQAWTNPDTGERFEVTPTETFSKDGRPCRSFRMEVEGQDEDVTGIACRTASGDWEIAG